MIRPRITLLDLGGVVFQSTGRSNEKINWDIISKLNNIYGHDLNIGEDLFPNFLSDYNKSTNQLLTGNEFLKEVFDTLEINTELIEFIRLHSEIVIVSDNYRENINYISERYEFQSWSIKQIYSFDYCMVKSNPKFFEKLVKELAEYKPEEMIFIDDSIKKIDSAAKINIKGILFRNNELVKKELKKFYN